MTDYELQGIPTSIKISSRASVKVGESFYTVEYCEERMIPQNDAVNMSEERQALWDVCNTEVDSQISDILSTFKK